MINWLSKKYNYCLICLSLSFYACGLFWGYEDLGNGYYFIDGQAPDIVYDSDISYNGSGGVNVIPYDVTSFAYNQDYIIARSERPILREVNFWIIDKSVKIDFYHGIDCFVEDCDKILKSNVLGPMDSTSFFIQLKQLNIDLVLSKP